MISQKVKSVDRLPSWFSCQYVPVTFGIAQVTSMAETGTETKFFILF